MNELTPSTDLLHQELRTVIADARERTAVAVNAELTRLYWHIGKRLAVEVLGGERAAYGQQVIATLGALPVLPPSSAAASKPRTCGGWCNSPRRSRTVRLSRHCRDN